MAYNSASELEKLVSNCEFENQQYVKLIEHEDQLIESLKKEIELKEEETKRLQEAVSQLDEDTKQCHKQYTLNRDNLESLKKTNHVLTEHVAAMDSKMEMLQHKIQAEKQEHNCHLQRYKDIWATYHDKYESLPLAVELKKQTIMVEEITKRNQETEIANQDAKQKIEQLQGQGEVYKIGTNAFIISLAKMRLATSDIKQEIERKRSELNEMKHTVQYIEQSDSDETNERNVQKLTDMHLVDKESSEERGESMESSDQQTHLETQSPMISMFGDRDDESEAMQTDVVSHDQVYLQFPEENIMSQHSETSHQQGQVTGVDDSSDPHVDLVDNKAQEACHSEVENSEVQCRLPATSENTPEANLMLPGIQSISQDAQLPFVAYKTKGPETVHIQWDRQQLQQQQQQQQQQQLSKVQNQSSQMQPQSITSNQPSSLRPNLLPSQRPANLQTCDGANSRSPFPGYRPHIPQVVIRPTSQFRPSDQRLRPCVEPSLRPSVTLNRPSYQPVSVTQARPSTPRLYVPPGKIVQGSHSLRPQPSPVPRSYHAASSPVVQLPRHTFGQSRLPVLQPVRMSVSSQLQRPPQLSVTNRLPGISADNHTQRFVQTSVSSAVRSPLQLTSPPVRLQSPQVVQRSPLQLPSQHQHILQQTARNQTSLPSHSSTGPGRHLKSGPETPDEIRQRPAQSKLSPDTNDTDRNLHTSTSPHTQTSISPHMQTSVSPHMQTSISPHTQTSISPHTQTSISPHMQTSISPHMQTSISPHMQTSIPSHIQTSISPHIQTSLSPHMQTSIPPHMQTSVSQLTQTSKSPHMQTSISPHMQTSISPHATQQDQEATVTVSAPNVTGTPQIGVKIPQSDGTSTYYMKVKDAPESSNEISSLDKSPVKPVTPELVDEGSLKEETFSPFDLEKHQKKLADMKKSPAHPDFYPAKRAFAEMEGNCQDVGSENMQFPLFGQAHSTLTAPLDGSGDHTNAASTKGQNSDQNTKSVTDTEVQSAFNFFGAFGSSNDASECKSPGYAFNFGSGDCSKTTESPSFSLFGACNNDSPSGFNFGFGDNSGVKGGSQPCSSGEGNFLSMFGDGGNEDQGSTTGFSFNFGSDRPKSPPFSFF